MNDFFESVARKDVKSPFNYTGTKFHLIDNIRQNTPENHSGVFWDVFCGGGSVFVNLSDEFDKVFANDIVVPLIEFYKLIQTTDWDDLVSIVSYKTISKTDKEEFLELRERFNSDRDCVDFFVLCCSCTNNMMRFNKSMNFNQTWGKRQVNPKTYEKLKGYHEVINGNNKINFSCLEFTDVIPNKGDFVYLDPPYLITEAGYNAFWSKEHEENLYSCLDTLDKAGVYFLLSNVSEHKGIKNPHIDRLKRYEIVDLDYDYDKVSRKGKSKSQEIFVKNF